MCRGSCASTARTISRSMGHREPRHTVGLKDHWERWKSQEGCWTGGGLHLGLENDHAAHTLQGKRKSRTHHPLTPSSLTFNAAEAGRRH